MLRGVRAKRRKRIAVRGSCPSVCNRLICTRTLSCQADLTGMACPLPKQGAPVLCALVTGATGGIGRELCAELVRDSRHAGYRWPQPREAR